MDLKLEVMEKVVKIHTEACCKCEKKLVVTEDCQKCMRIIDGEIHMTQFEKGFWA